MLQVMLCVQVLEGGLTLVDPQVDISKVQPTPPASFPAGAGAWTECYGSLTADRFAIMLSQVILPSCLPVLFKCHSMDCSFSRIEVGVCTSQVASQVHIVL